MMRSTRWMYGGAARGRQGAPANRNTAPATRAMFVLLAGMVLATIAGCRPELRTQTYTLRSLNPAQARQLATPYVEGTGGTVDVSTDPPAMTVHGPRASLDAIAAMLRRYDRPPVTVTLHYQVIEADGFAGADSAIADVESALRQVFRFKGYRLVADGVVNGTEFSDHLQQHLAGATGDFDLTTNIGRVTGVGDSLAAVVRTQLVFNRHLALTAAVTVTNGQTMVMGSARPDAKRGALILVVRPRIERAGAQ